MFTFAIWYSWSVCRLSEMFVHPTQPVKISAMFLRHLVPWPSVDIRGKFYGDRPRGTRPLEGLNTRWVAKYGDFGAFGGHNLETVQDTR